MRPTMRLMVIAAGLVACRQPTPISIFSGEASTCVLYENGEIKCWGAERIAPDGYKLAKKPSSLGRVEGAIRLDGAAYPVAVDRAGFGYWISLTSIDERFPRDGGK